MMARLAAALLGWSPACAVGTEVPGRARASWLAESGRVEAGQSIRTAVRLAIEPGWHTYWINPGEAGMSTKAEWKLPPGWTTGDLNHPVPQRFKTGELHGYGHEGTVWFPVELRAPANLKGPAELRATVTWLACRDDACMPGEAELVLVLESGAPEDSPHAPEIRSAFDRLPRLCPAGTRLKVVDGKPIELIIEGDPLPFDPADAEVFPSTPDVLDSKPNIRFVRHGGAWRATAPRGSYAPASIPALELLLVSPSDGSAVRIGWRRP